MATIDKKVELELSPADIMRAIRALNREKRDELTLEIQQLLLNEGMNEGTDALDFVQAVLPPEVEEPELWLKPPPHTPEGDREALAAVDDFCGMFPITNLELARWLAESSELSLLGND